jgi:hypothetical protein
MFKKIGLNLRIGSKLGITSGIAQAALAAAPGRDQAWKEF